MMKKKRFKKWVERYKDMIYNQAYYFSGNPADAADITQEVLLKMWTHFDTITNRTIKNWLLKVTRNQCIDMSRKKKEVGLPVHITDDGSEIEQEIRDQGGGQVDIVIIVHTGIHLWKSRRCRFQDPLVGNIHIESGIFGLEVILHGILHSLPERKIERF